MVQGGGGVTQPRAHSDGARVGVGVADGVAVSVGMAVAVGGGVAVSVAVAVSVGGGNGVAVARAVGIAAGVAVGTAGGAMVGEPAPAAQADRQQTSAIARIRHRGVCIVCLPRDV